MDFDREAFIDGYVEAALWADGMPVTGEELGGLEHLDIRPEARDYMAADCQTFIDANRDDLIAYCQYRPTSAPYDESQGPPESYAGHDFWLTRGGHGAGFWDRGLGELGDRLAKAAQAYNEGPRPYDCGDGTTDVDKL